MRVLRIEYKSAVDGGCAHAEQGHRWHLFETREVRFIVDQRQGKRANGESVLDAEVQRFASGCQDLEARTGSD
jgi:hypothetical protein